MNCDPSKKRPRNYSVWSPILMLNSNRIILHKNVYINEILEKRKWRNWF